MDKTFADADYTEIAERLYGQPYSSDVARRMMYGSRKTLDLIEDADARQTMDKDILAEYDEKIDELKKERQKFFDQRREYNKILSKEAREEHLFESLSAAADRLNETVGVVYNTDGVAVDHPVGDLSENEAVLVFSDWHYGMKTKNSFNTFNTSICKSRVNSVAERAAKRISLHNCRRLHIVVLGDLFHGAIHTSARVASEELVCDQLMQVSELLAQTIEYLSMFVPETIVYITYGNHARTIQKKEDNIHRDNMERLIPWWLGQRLANSDDIQIEGETGNEFLFVNVCGHDICAAHGDNDSVKDSPRLLTTLFHKQYKKDIEYILLGDKHHRESFNELGVTALLCGSLCGADDYANNKRLFSDPSQMLLIFNEDGLDAEYRIKCK